jgi:hypothetical protein
MEAILGTRKAKGDWKQPPFAFSCHRFAARGSPNGWSVLETFERDDEDAAFVELPAIG